MPKKKTDQAPVQTPATTATVTDSANGAKIKKSDALREALQQLGADAKNTDLADYIKQKYGAEALPASISVAKSNLKHADKEKAKKKKAMAKASPAPVAPRRTASTSGDVLAAIRAARQLIQATGGKEAALEVLKEL